MIELLIATAMMTSRQDPVATELTFQGVGIELEGTLTAPADAKNRPAILMMPGSGPSDRDGNQPPLVKTDVLKQLSDHLVSEGYVTFRFDKRPVATNRSKWPTDREKISEFFSFENHIADSLAAYQTLQKRPEANPEKLFVLGHSEGGMITLAMANQTNAAGLLLLGTPGRSMTEIIQDQINRSVDASTLSDEAKAKFKEDHAKVIAAVKAEPKIPADVPQGLAALYNFSTAHIMHGYFNWDPQKLASSYQGPVLVANGQSDIQIDAEKDAKALFATLQERDNQSQDLLLIDKASHNFKRVESESDLGFEGEVVPELIKGITDFLAKHTN